VERTVLVSASLVAVAIGLAFVPARGANKEPGRAPKTNAPATIGLVFDVGGRGDKSFNDAAYQGLVQAEERFGVATNYLEPTGSDDREAALRMFAAQGMDLVIGVGFIFSHDVDTVARAYPNVHFACVDYAPSPQGIPANVAGLAFREDEGSYLIGALAGLLSKSGHVGFVGGMENPLIRKFERGFALGVGETCSKCVVHSGYAGSTPDAFRDPAKGKAIAASQIAYGADVLFHAAGATGHGVFEAAKGAKVAAIGVDSDQHDEAPGTVVSSMVKRVDVAVVSVVQEVLERRFRGGMHVLGVRDGAIDFVHDGPHAKDLPAEAVQKVLELKSHLVDGSRTIDH
jgi:basic membrane protein A